MCLQHIKQKEKEQLKELLGGVEPGMLGIEELVLLLIWTKPLVSTPGTARANAKD